MEHILSFPGLGIGEFKVSSVAFSLFGRNIAWYGIIVTLGIITAFCYSLYRSKFEKIKQDDVLDLAIFVIVFGVVGARLYYVLTKLEDYHSFGEMIAIWNGGLAIYGGIIAGGLAGFIVAKVKKIPFLKLFDMMAPGVMIAQSIGRWGNFVNAEAHGGETDIFCRMGIMSNSTGVMKYYHPTFLYESLWNLIGFILINAFYKKKKYNGQIFFMYMSWYGFGRFFIEGLRTDSLYVGPFRISQVVGIVSFVVGIVLMIVFAKRSKTLSEEHDAVSSVELSPVPAEGEEAEEKENESETVEETEKTAEKTEDTKEDTENGEDN